MSVKVEQGADTGMNWLLALVAIGAVPVGVGIYHAVFTSKRWEGSGIQPFDRHRHLDDDEGDQDEPEPEPPPLPLAGDPLPVAKPAKRK